MTSLQLYRLSGLALVIGMVLSTVSSIASAVVFPDSTDVAAAVNPLNILLSVLGAVGTMLALFGLPGMYVRAASEGGRLWLIGVVLIAITGMLFGVFVGLASAVVFPAVASQAANLFSQGPPPAFLAVFVVATLANVFGAILMAVPMITRGIYARWCGYVLLAAAALGVINFVTGGPGATSLVSQILGVIAPLPLYLVLGWAGYKLWSSDSGLAADGATRSVAAPRVRLSA